VHSSLMESYTVCDTCLGGEVISVLTENQNKITNCINCRDVCLEKEIKIFRSVTK
jgi:hypothetical protein